MTDLIILEGNPLDIHLLDRVFENYLEKIKYKIIDDGEIAMNYFENELNPMPKIIFMDIKVPKISGLEILKKIRKIAHLQFVPIVMLSSSNQENDIKMAYEYGANSYLTKSEDFNVFRENLKVAVDYWVNCNITINANE